MKALQNFFISHSLALFIVCLSRCCRIHNASDFLLIFPSFLLVFATFTVSFLRYFVFHELLSVASVKEDWNIFIYYIDKKISMQYYFPSLAVCEIVRAHRNKNNSMSFIFFILLLHFCATICCSFTHKMK
jgi:hypothetical protein